MLISFHFAAQRKGSRPREQLSIICQMLWSKRPSDVQAAMIHLLKRSFEAPESITRDHLDAIVDALIPFVQPLWTVPSGHQSQTSQSMDSDTVVSESQSDTDPTPHSADSSLTFDAFRILRNLSFI